MDAAHNKNTCNVSLAKTKQIMYGQYDERSWKRGVRDMGQGTCFVLPDHGAEFKKDTMRYLGFTLHQDFVYANDLDGLVRWWFRNKQTHARYIKAIKKMGYVPTSDLQIT